MIQETHVLDRPPEGAAADWTIPQNWDGYTQEDHGVWDTLLERQMKLLPGRAAQAYMNGLEALRLSERGIPNFEELSERLMKLTGWQVVAVPGLVPDDVFFEHMANRRFVAGNFIRRPDQLDYIQEPDVFHDVFGHVPMLADPRFADYLEAYGRGGLRALDLGMLKQLGRLYWYTVEFGLVRDEEGLRIYGSGIVSSSAESRFALESDSPNRIGFDLRRVMRTEYRIDDFQQNYFVIDSFDDLLRQTTETDFAPLYDSIRELPDIPIAAILEKDEVITHGTQEYARSKAEGEAV
ncbi:phenylalanine 4-monooxygenase [Stakelama tenebrarum]|uniref:Phenylalanine-4-hydroxylase n=1 Tax=Stakelama tenebrarum TaxID=2711215 RepID=A0A6G6Y9W3_9SPHN|nr:phenylalanine 4-monooxygenase [Sphingosinithalassobacter tenebrarum]QIG81498.1 phenylalanine 4-monooxygenase [Sphingosinithalassobacter tenebrarum]